jgi:hypothetical protein
MERLRVWADWGSGVSKRLARGLLRAIALGFSSSRAYVRPGLLAVLLLVLAPVCLLLSQSGLHASDNTITVNNLTDPVSTSGNGFCTLREAIDNAESPGVDTTAGDCAVATGTDTIVFTVSGEITLASALPAINNTPVSLMIDGAGQAVGIDGANSFQVFSVKPLGRLRLANLKISRGSGAGGAIANSGGLSVTQCTIAENTAPASMNGGGISNVGSLGVSNSTFFDNVAATDGGGIFNNGGSLAVSNSTFSTNSAGSSGGGIFNSGTAAVTNCTFSGNSSESGGGAIFHIGGGTIGITNSTFSGNSDTSSGGGIDNAFSTGPFTISNSILSSNINGNCAGSSVTNGGSNIADDATCAFGSSTGASGQTIGDNVNPLLVPNPLFASNNLQFLQYYGGPTQTIALQAGSPAIAAIASTKCPFDDQRGGRRPAPGQSACDIGAFELGAVGPPVAAPIEVYVGSDFFKSTFVSTVDATESITVNSTPGVQAGDLVLVALLTYQSCTPSSAYTITPPSGFTPVTMASGSNPIFNWDTSGGVAEVFQKTADASEPSSYTFTTTNPCSSGSQLTTDYGITVWSNVAATPVQSAAENVTACAFATSCNVVANAVTTTVADEMLVPMYFAGNREPTWACNLPGGYDFAWGFQDNTFSLTCGGYLRQSAIGSTGNLTVDMSGFGKNPSGFPGLAFLVAVAPGSMFGSPTPTATGSPGATPTRTATATPTATATSTIVSSATPTATATATASSSGTATATATGGASQTATVTATPTSTVTATATTTGSPQATPTRTPTATATSTTVSSATPTATATATARSTQTATATATASGTQTATSTETPTPTPVPVGLHINPPSLNFGAVKVGSQKGPKNITVSNPKNSGATVLMEGVSGVAGTEFSVMNGCTAPLAPGAQCTIAVTFAPTTTGKQHATLMILDNAKGAPQSVELKGKGKSPV